MTVQDAKNPANKKTVTIKDIASKTELDNTKTELINKGLKFDADNGGEKQINWLQGNCSRRWY